MQVRALLPAKVNGDALQGSWPAIWLLGQVGGWPTNGEIDIVELVNGDPKIYHTTHSTNNNGGNGQVGGDSKVHYSYFGPLFGSFF